jgi:hypothetical protein
MVLQSNLYAAAAVASLASAGLHAFAGGAIMARPFYRKAPVSGISTGPFRYCWHFVTVTLVAMAAGYAVLSQRPDLAPFGVYLTAQAMGVSALSFIVSGIEKAPPLKSPPAILGAIIAAFGLAALSQGL